MTKDTKPCPTCGAQATGQYCASCGAPLTGAPCPACNTVLTPGARFCHMCGQPMGKAQKAGPRASGAPDGPWTWPLAVAGFAVVIAALFLWASRDARPKPPDNSIVGQPVLPDLSQMSPREQADRLFDRIIQAAERGDTAEVTRFQPMAVQAYAMLGRLDNDARYHVGLVHALAGQIERANAQVDSLRITDPNHLLAAMLQYTVAQFTGDERSARAASAAFLEHYDDEVARETPEYQGHREAIDAFRGAALSDAGRN